MTTKSSIPRWCLLLLAALTIGGLPAWAQYEPVRLSDPSRRWAADLSLRSEYDDNIFTSSSNKVDSIKAVITPRLLVNIPAEQTFIGFRYAYSATYYENRATDNVDQSHNVDLLFSHTFNPRLVLNLNERFRYGVEPDIVEIEAGQPVVLSRRGDFLNNSVDGSLSYNLTPRWQGRVSGRWLHWDYDEASASVNDRDEYQGTLSTIFLPNPRTSVGLNYRYGRIEYDQTAQGTTRNSDSQFVYLSATRRFNPQFSGDISAGGEYRKFDDGVDQLGPYVVSSLAYTYAEGSSISGGFQYSISTTEAAGFRSTDTASFYGRVTHKITPKLSASGNFVFSFSSFENPSGPVAVTSPEEETLDLGINVRYQFTRWFSGELGYTYNEQFSNIAGREFSRNRVYLGGRLTY